jgi:hypothetical protein
MSVPSSCRIWRAVWPCASTGPAPLVSGPPTADGLEQYATSYVPHSSGERSGFLTDSGCSCDTCAVVWRRGVRGRGRAVGGASGTLAPRRSVCATDAHSGGRLK